MTKNSFRLLKKNTLIKVSYNVKRKDYLPQLSRAVDPSFFTTNVVKKGIVPQNVQPAIGFLLPHSSCALDRLFCSAMVAEDSGNVPYPFFDDNKEVFDVFFDVIILS